jgi:hypothetical protein
VVLRSSLVALVALVMFVAGCLHRAPVARLATSTPITVVVLADDANGTRADAPPQALASELSRRNLAVEAAPDAALVSLDGTHDTRTRAELLAKALGPDKLFLLVELRAEFFAQMQGAWKWNVDAQVTIARTDDLPHDTSVSQRTPVFLDSESDREREAFAAAEPLMSDRIGRLVDDYFAAHAAAVSPAQPTPTSTQPPSQPPTDTPSSPQPIAPTTPPTAP